MSAYMIADIKVTDGSWVPDYAARVHELVGRHGGRYLSRSGKVSVLEGPAKDSTLIAILEFPSREALDGFLADPDYSPFGEARRRGSQSSFVAIDDSDIAGTIPYLPAG